MVATQPRPQNLQIPKQTHCQGSPCPSHTVEGDRIYPIIDPKAFDPVGGQQHDRPTHPPNQGSVGGADGVASGGNGYQTGDRTVDEDFHFWQFALIPTQCAGSEHSHRPG